MLIAVGTESALAGIVSVNRVRPGAMTLSDPPDASTVALATAFDNVMRTVGARCACVRAAALLGTRARTQHEAPVTWQKRMRRSCQEPAPKNRCGSAPFLSEASRGR